MKSDKLLWLVFLFVIANNLVVRGTVKLSEIRTASSNVFVLLFKSDTVDLQEIDISNKTRWTINGEPVLNLFQYITEADQCDHSIYLETNKLINGNKYQIETPYCDTTISFEEGLIFCESIKTNQVGYSPYSKVRYANFAIWLGTGGSRKIEGVLPSYEVIETLKNKTILKGVFQEIGFDSSSGDFVYRINLANIPEGGPYKIVVPGYGSSYPFGIGGTYSARLSYITFRSQYLQRCGCPIEKPNIRKNACHTTIYDTDGPIGEANIVVEGNEPIFKCYGGYHDAGDADRRAYHIINPIVNLMIYEAFPTYFSDNQYDIPGKFDEKYNILAYTNDIPDIIDEAAWGTLIWEYLQNEDGSIHFGTETKGYPEPFDATMDKDNKRYGTVKIDPRATCTSAGLFLHLARLIRTWDKKKSSELIQRAEMAMAFGESDMAAPEKLYFYIQKYLLTGDENDHDKIRQLYTIADSLPYHIFRTQGYSLNDIHFDNPAYIYSYIIEKEKKTDPSIVKFFTSAIQAAADSTIKMLHSHAYPIGNKSDEGGWGHNVRQPQYAGIPLLYWNLSKEQKYFDAASELLDWKLGLNPMGICFVTGLGFHQVHNPHDRESAYTKRLGMGPKPGITVFGPGVSSWWRKSLVIPDITVLPKERQFVDDIRAISFTEFTIFETLTHEALYTIIASEGK